MKYIDIIILLVLCLTLLLFTGCRINTVKPEPADSSTGPVEEPIIEEDTEATVTVYPQQWATGVGTVENPWANDCIKKALDFAPAGGTIFLKSGYYTLSNEVKINKAINIIGEGINKSIIVLDNAHANGIAVDADYCTLKGFTIDGDAQTDGELWLSCIAINNCDYVSLEDIKVKNAGYYGIDFFQNNHSLLQNIYAHDNYRHGIHPGADIAGRNIYNTYRDIYAWNNGNSGFKDRGIEPPVPSEKCYNIFDNLQCWDNGEFGIMIAYQRDSVLSNSFASGNVGKGIYLVAVEDFNVQDCSTILSGEEGLYIGLSKNVNLANVVVKNNYTGLRIDNSSNIVFTACQSYDDRDTPLQAYGIELAGSNTNISLVNCKLMPNKEGEIYNPAGVVLTVIAEKKDCPSFSSF